MSTLQAGAIDNHAQKWYYDSSMGKMNKTRVSTSSTSKGIKQNLRLGFLKDQRGVNVIEALILIAIIVVLLLLVIPNLNIFLGTDKKIAVANTEALNVRAAALAYEANEGVFPNNSDLLWSEPPKPGDYVGELHAYYTFDVGTGRIMNASTDTLGHLPADPWKGIRWDPDTDSWVKQ